MDRKKTKLLQKSPENIPSQCIELSEKELVNIVGGTSEAIIKDFRGGKSSIITLDYIAESL